MIGRSRKIMVPGLMRLWKFLRRARFQCSIWTLPPNVGRRMKPGRSNGRTSLIRTRPFPKKYSYHRRSGYMWDSANGLNVGFRILQSHIVCCSGFSRMHAFSPFRFPRTTAPSLPFSISQLQSSFSAFSTTK